MISRRVLGLFRSRTGTFVGHTANGGGRCWLSTSADLPLKKRGRPRKDPLADELTHTVPHTKPQVGSFFDQVDEMMKDQNSQSEHAVGPTSVEAATLQATDISAASKSSLSNNTKAPEKSLFDVFKIPEPAPKRSPTAFDAVACEHYQTMLNQIMSSDKKFRRQHTANPIGEQEAEPVIAWLQSEEPNLPTDLSLFRQALQQGVNTTTAPGSKRSKEFVGETESQRSRFITGMGWNGRQYKMAKGTVLQMANICARQASGQPLDVLWEKIKEAGIVDQKILQGLLYVSATFSTGNRRKRARYGRIAGLVTLDVLDTDPASDESNDEDEDLVDVTDEIAIYHDLLHNPTEQSISIRVRLLVAQGHAEAAERLLDAQSEGEIRLRAYNPVLRLYLEQGEFALALKLYRRMQSMPLVHFDAETYVHVVAKIAENGLFHESATPVEGAKELGFSSGSGPSLFNELVTDMAQEVIEIPSSCAQRLCNAFLEGFPVSGSAAEKSGSLSPLKPAVDRAASDEMVACRVSIDPKTGACPRSGATLRLISLNQNEREQLRESVRTLARNSQTSFRERTNLPQDKRSKFKADEMLDVFYKALDDRTGEPFTVVIDGPNIGYYMQNFQDGRFNFHQIKLIVESLESRGERPLVIMPRKYTYDNFVVTVGNVDDGRWVKQFLSREELAIRDDLISSGKVYVVPPALLDDYYWILATISDQVASRKGKDLYVPPGDPSGKWPGARPLIITNDQMVDHKLEMMDPMLFRRWYSNYIVNYNFSAFVKEGSTMPEPSYSNADFFSREIQGNVSEANELAWHFPLSDMGENDWFCLRIPDSTSAP